MKVLLAISGGIDSMTMAELVFSHSHIIPFQCGEFGIAHCNFHLREGDCDLDEALVRTWAEEHAVDFYRQDFDTVSYAKEHGLSIEMAARELRYRWFAEICREHGYEAVATAHHADDNAETLILNLCRGTGLRGICGMTQEDVLPYSEGQLKLVRPLLGLSREQIEQYAAEHGVPYRTDRTNLESNYKRNKIRNLLMPLMKELNPSLVVTLNSDMTHFRESESICELWYREHSSILSEGSVRISELLSAEGWEYLLWRWLDAEGFDSSTIGDLRKVLKSGGTVSGRVFEGRGVKLVSGQDCLRLVRTCASAPLNNVIGLETEILPYEGFRPEGCLSLDSDAVGPFTTRPWQDGDWFVPFGMNVRKKNSDWFNDQKTDLEEKRRARVLVSDRWEKGRVAAVLTSGPCRQDERTRVTEKTLSLLTVRVSSEK